VSARDILQRAVAQQAAMQTRINNQMAAINRLLGFALQAHMPAELPLQLQRADGQQYVINSARVEDNKIIIEISPIGRPGTGE
jgi:hypothetical protein